jgi:hypothetical protein
MPVEELSVWGTLGVYEASSIDMRVLLLKRLDFGHDVAGSVVDEAVLNIDDKQRLVGVFHLLLRAIPLCHSERSEESEVCEWRSGNDFRFFTPLRCVQNDREGTLRSE